MGVIGPLIWVLTIATRPITPLIATHELGLRVGEKAPGLKVWASGVQGFMSGFGLGFRV